MVKLKIYLLYLYDTWYCSIVEYPDYIFWLVLLFYIAVNNCLYIKFCLVFIILVSPFFCKLDKRRIEPFRILFSVVAKQVFLLPFETVLHPVPSNLHFYSRLVAFWMVYLNFWDFSTVLLWLIQYFLDKVHLPFLLYALIWERHTFKWFPENKASEGILRPETFLKALFAIFMLDWELCRVWHHRSKLNFSSEFWEHCFIVIHLLVLLLKNPILF